MARRSDWVYVGYMYQSVGVFRKGKGRWDARGIIWSDRKDS